MTVFPRPVAAGIRPSFSIDYSSWHATDIALVEATDKPAVFRVIESWKGQLQPGETIDVPELRPAVEAVSLSSYPQATFLNPHEELTEQIPAQLCGARMVVFLRNDGKSESASPMTPGSHRGWKPVEMSQEMKASVIWIDGEQLYVFRQLTNPGPSVLVRWDVTLNQAKERAMEISRTQSELMEIVSAENSVARAEKLKPYVHSGIYDAQQLALGELGKGGLPAVKTISGMLDSTTFAEEAPELVKALSEAGAESVGEDLNHRLKREQDFWRVAGPGLSQGWWNQDPRPHAPLQDKYLYTIELIRGLDHIHYRPASDTARELAKFWRSLPQLNDSSGLNQMADECEALVTHLQAN
jgi:hypothetical protein